MVKIKSVRFNPNYWLDMSQPSMIYHLSIEHEQDTHFPVGQFNTVIQTFFPGTSDQTFRLNPVINNNPFLRTITIAALHMLTDMGMPVMSGARAIRVPNEESWYVALPAVSERFQTLTLAMNWLVELSNQMLTGQKVDKSLEKKKIDQLLNQARIEAPQGINTLRFLMAAHETNMPWMYIADNVYQFGWGGRSRLLNSSMTDETPAVSTLLARNKMSCAALLRKAGLPAPVHKSAASADDAVSIAGSLGYPVVVKAYDLDGGQGVYAYLKNPEQVRQAFELARKASKNILVEKFIEGDDHRLQVYKDTVYWAIKRRPAYIVGDGVTSVEGLIASVNSNLDQEVDIEGRTETRHKPIVVDDEIQKFLSEAGLSLSSVPQAGLHVRLRGAANVTSGGTLQPVLEQVHPDNVELAKDAAKVLRLDLAGIDLIIPDISKSWRDTGAAICEVNAQPQMSLGLHGQILRQLVKHNGRIPIIGIMGSELEDTFLANLTAFANDKGLNIGYLSDSNSYINGRLTSAHSQTINQSIRQLLFNPELHCLVVHFKTAPQVDLGLSVDRLDLMFWESTTLGLAETAHEQNLFSWIKTREIPIIARKLTEPTEQIFTKYGVRYRQRTSASLFDDIKNSLNVSLLKE